ncbi:MAG TPA: bifunctional glycosyltransferase/class I SAM-dependent methyltransferase [Thermoanaerobaculia bacterium]|nr:bifunctional glycosyltransferase/class I SAM-dependent methyltransferase [Thermoanaerobaculia bacterium]
MTRMGSTRVTVVLPLLGRGVDVESARASIAKYLESTGFAFDIVAVEGGGYGELLRRGVADARGGVVVIVDPELPYPATAIGDAVAMIESGATDIVFGSARPVDAAEPGHFLLRMFLVPRLPDPAIHLRAFSESAAHLVVGESKLAGGGCDLEIAFLANKYGFRVERLFVHPATPLHTPRSFGAVFGLASVMRIRLNDRNNAYRASRRCPVCFSNEVWSCAQIPANIVRACRRCKCRYLNRFADEDDTHPVRRVLRAHPPAAEPDEPHSVTAREKTSFRRLAALRRPLAARARLLEIGVRDGSFGTAASQEFEYVGIDPISANARGARSRGLDVYCASLANFVNTGPAFDAIALFHVLENMAEPHDALGRIKDLLKPGGILFLTAFDTEGLLYLMTERNRMAHNFRTHLILYSRSALIELLEHSGFEIVSVGPDFEYRDHKFLRHWIASRRPRFAWLAKLLLPLPDPLLLSSGSMRIIAKRRGGSPMNVRAIRSVEATHAR